MFRFVFFIFAIYASFSSQATIYKCMIDGIATFTQQPCGKDAEIVKITPPPTSNHANEQPHSQQNTTELSVDDYLKVQQVDREIQRLELAIKELQKQQNERITRLNEMTQDTANKLGAESIGDAINTQSERVNSYYKSQISAIETQITQLNENKKQLTGQHKNIH